MLHWYRMRDSHAEQALQHAKLCSVSVDLLMAKLENAINCDHELVILCL